MRRIGAIWLAVLLMAVPLFAAQIPAQAALAPAPTVLAPGCYLADTAYPNDPLLSKAADTRLAPSSTTKLMTALLVLERCKDLSEPVTIPLEAVQQRTGSSLMGIKRGEVYSVAELLYGLLLVSGNDAATALAVHCAGSERAFVDEMNTRAFELGMLNTNFCNPSGVYDKEHLTTARDMALLMAQALQNENFREIVGTAQIQLPATSGHRAYNLKNSNRLISDPENSGYYYEFAIGGKTGTTTRGGNTLVTAAEKDGVTLVCVLIGLPYENTGGQRELFEETRQLYEYAYANLYASLPPEVIPAFACEIVAGGVEELAQYRLYSGAVDALYLPRSIVENPQSLLPQTQLFFAAGEAPPSGQVGVLRYVLDGTTYIEVPLFAEKLYTIQNTESVATLAQDIPSAKPLRNPIQPLNAANILFCIGLVGLIPLMFWSRLRIYRKRNKTSA
ncbi:MAG: serine hydrolase [Clostridiales bacterium]|nr:serine hydrolase [Clostridiales bacterium]